jgi:hypothetical protein
MKRRVSEKILKRIGRYAGSLGYGDDEYLLSSWEASVALYRTSTVLKAKRRRSLNSGGTVCLDCAVFYGLDRC